MRIAHLLPLVIGLAGTLGALVPPPAAAGGEHVVVVTATGHRIAGEAGEAAPGFLGLRVGGRTYELEREGSRIEGEGSRVAQTDWEDLVADLARRLDHPDEALAGAARAGLLALGAPALPYLERAARRAPAGRRALLEAVADALRAGEAEDGER